MTTTSDVTSLTVDYNNPTELATYLAELAGNKGDIDKDVNPNKLSPKITMSKDNDLLTVKLDDSLIGSPTKFLYILIEHSVGLRSLWVPEKHPAKDEFKSPLCTTGLIPTTTLTPDKAHGIYLTNDVFSPPYVGRDASGNQVDHATGTEVSYECAKCPWNKFESERAFDPTKPDGKGKACKESRVLFVRTMKKVTGMGAITTPNGEELNAFDIDNTYGDDPLRLVLGLGSNKKPFEDMVIAARARNLPVASSIWKLGVTINGDGSIKYPSAKFEFVGFPTKAAFTRSKNDDAKWIEGYVERNARVGVEADIAF